MQTNPCRFGEFPSTFKTTVDRCKKAVQEASWCRNCCVWLLHLPWNTFSKQKKHVMSEFQSMHQSPNVAHLIAWICWRKQVEYVFHKISPNFTSEILLGSLLHPQYFFFRNPPKTATKARLLGRDPGRWCKRLWENHSTSRRSQGMSAKMSVVYVDIYLLQIRNDGDYLYKNILNILYI